MFALNVSCPVCKAAFTNSDAIYSTSCGHIFHFSCMNQWRSKSTSCPQCRSYNPTTHSIYLNFEDTREYETIVNDLKTKLQISDAKVNKTKEEVDKKEQKIDEIKRLYNISEQWRAELENKIQNLSHELQVKNVNHTKELTMKLNEIQSLKTHIETVQRAEGVHELCEKINKLEEELKQTTMLLTTENSKLKENLNEAEASKIILNHKIEMLEQRLKHVTLELKKQIEESVHQSMDNIISTDKQTKLNKGRMRHNNKHNKTASETILTEQKSNAVHTLEEEKNVDLSLDKKTRITPETKPKHKNGNMQHNSHKTVDLTKLNIKRTRQFELTQPNDCKVIIKDFPKDDIVYPLTNAVIVLASKMSLTLSSEDMSKVSIVEHKKITNCTNKVVLLVEFKTIDGKIKFLSNRNRLKFNSSTKFIQLKEYIDEAVYPVFMYANRLLRANGYEYIICKDNKVFAKKNRHDIAEIAIKNRNDVDRLLGRPLSQNPIRLQPRMRNTSYNLFEDYEKFPFYNLNDPYEILTHENYEYWD
ncbi:uncharacterized protein LOC135958894 [Calliphora vicina]|uniref:uncharacterized protein LOC135958894 n=1 Tax=Calliphora vicina TaxID=7373 RepID=UPI00325B5B7B